MQDPKKHRPNEAHPELHINYILLIFFKQIDIDTIKNPGVLTTKL